MLNFLNIRGRGVDFQILFFLQKLNPPQPGRGVNFMEQAWLEVIKVMKQKFIS